MWWKWVLDTVGRFNIEKVWDEIVGDNGFVRKNWQLLSAGGLFGVIGSIFEKMSVTWTILAALAGAGFALFLANQYRQWCLTVVPAKNATTSHIHHAPEPTTLRAPDEDKPPAKTIDLANSTARWLYLRDQNTKVDEAWEKLIGLHPLIEHVLEDVNSYDHPEIKQLLSDWALGVNELDRIFRDWLGTPIDISHRAFSPSAQPARAGLSRDDEVTYKKFYAQVSVWTKEGEHYRAMMKREENVARESVFHDARRVKFRVG